MHLVPLIDNTGHMVGFFDDATAVYRLEGNDVVATLPGGAQAVAVDDDSDCPPYRVIGSTNQNDRATDGVSPVRSIELNLCSSPAGPMLARRSPARRCQSRNVPVTAPSDGDRDVRFSERTAAGATPMAWPRFSRR